MLPSSALDPDAVAQLRQLAGPLRARYAPTASSTQNQQYVQADLAPAAMAAARALPQAQLAYLQQQFAAVAAAYSPFQFWTRPGQMLSAPVRTVALAILWILAADLGVTEPYVWGRQS
jgi:hypothetical protein